MSLVRVVIRSREPFIRPGHRGLSIPASYSWLLGRDLSFAHNLRQLLVRREPIPLGPFRLQRSGGANGGPLARSHDSEEVLHSHDANVGDAGYRRLVYRDEVRAHGWGTNDAAM